MKCFCTTFIRQKNFCLVAIPRMRAVMNFHHASRETGSMQLVPRSPRIKHRISGLLQSVGDSFVAINFQNLFLSLVNEPPDQLKYVVCRFKMQLIFPQKTKLSFAPRFHGETQFRAWNLKKLFYNYYRLLARLLRIRCSPAVLRTKGI